MNLELFDNLMWNALSGPHAHWSQGGATARRYAPGFSPIIAFADPLNPDFAALEAHCAPGEPFYCEGWLGVPPAGWLVQAESSMVKMAWGGGVPDEGAGADDIVPLNAAHAPQMLALAELTRPGPFGLRTVEMGDYFGVIGEDGRLIAMAGERMRAGKLREISGVATHLDAQGRGLARRLMLRLLRRQLARGETPVLHVMSANAGARGLYLKMGWREYREVAVRVMARQA